ncbi:MAG: purine-nucleoside phosphorylase [Bifidobacteriaceae bacterium]|jgi:purine-nucleoside phosphorylase|nr:purine-nucleoside phosphorylase [Bifidobacteriaceae bacterium]
MTRQPALPASPDPIALASQAAAAVVERTGIKQHQIAVILGSGWGGAGRLIGQLNAEIPAHQLPGFNPSPIPGHAATIQSVRVGETTSQALLIAARSHYYERRDPQAVAHPVRLAAAAGAKVLVLTNGCGAAAPWPAGTVALISDHINLTGATPLVGADFVDLTDLYSARLRRLVKQAHPDLQEGIYAQFPGPQYETPAEVRMARTLGADLVGMSTALEAIAARAAGLEVLGLSFATNTAAGLSEQPLSHGEVLEIGRVAAPRLAELLADVVGRLASVG